MAKPGRLPDFRKMYPEPSEEVIEVLRETERKMQYQEYDLRRSRPLLTREHSRSGSYQAGRIPMNGLWSMRCSFWQMERIQRRR